MRFTLSHEPNVDFHEFNVWVLLIFKEYGGAAQVLSISSLLFGLKVVGNRNKDDVVLVEVADDKLAERRTQLKVSELLILIVALQLIFCSADSSQFRDNFIQVTADYVQADIKFFREFA